MSRLSSRFSVVLGTTLCFGALAVAGCGGSSSPEPSADATCADFGKMSEADQKTTAQDVLEANGASTDGLGAGVKIDGARAVIKAYCKASGDTAKVKNVTQVGDALDKLQEKLPVDSSGDGNSAK